MKVLFLLAYYNPETAASIYLFDNVIDKLIESGVDVELICPVPGRGVDASVNIEYRQRLEESTQNGHLHIRRYKMYMEGKGTLGRFVRYFFCCIKHYWWGVRARDVDVIFSESTPPILGATAALIKKRLSVPLLYNLQDIFPDSLVLTGVSREGSLTWRIGSIIEQYTYRHSDKIVTISNDFKKNILAKGVPEKKIEVVYNWVDQNAVTDISRCMNKLFDKYGLDRSKFYVTYNGNIGLSQNMDMLLDVAEEIFCDYKDIHFVLVGAGTYLDQVKRIVAEKNLNNVHFLPFQPYEDISYVFSLGDVSLVISKPGTGSGCVPSKTWSIMSASRPVLANFDENELKDIIEENGCGLFTKAGDKEGFKNAILRLYGSQELCKTLGQNGRRFIMNNLTKEYGAGRYVEVIKTMLGK